MGYKYSKQISLGYNSEGKRIRKRVYANSEQELKRKEKELLMQADQALTSTIPLEDYIDEWWEAYKANLSINTQTSYRQYLKPLEPLYRRPINSIKRTDLQRILNSLWGSPSACRYAHKMMTQIFKAAVVDALITVNPTLGLTLPKRQKQEKRIFTDAELDKIKAIDTLTDQEYLFMAFEIYLGLRPEETRALCRSDIKDGYITISKAVVYDGSAPVIKDTKTGAHRRLPIPDALQSILDVFKGTSLYFFTRNGKLFSKGEYARLSAHILSDVNRVLSGTDGLKLSGISMYTFRHTRATQLYYLTQTTHLSTKAAAAYMGHSEMMFLKTYSHIDESRNEDEILRNGVPFIGQDNLKSVPEV